MRGKAGAGKSTMMKFVYLETKKVKKRSMAVVSFFFNARGDYLERSISGMYRSLLLQLLQEFSDLQSVLDNTDIVPRNQQDCPFWEKEWGSITGEKYAERIVSRTNHIARPSGAHPANQQGASVRRPHEADPG
jgi:hypothetical protein